MSPDVTVLKTKRMTLRHFLESDLVELSRLHFDEEVMRFLVGGKRDSMDAVQKDLSNYIRHQERHGFGKWAIIHTETGEFMGRAGLMSLETGEIDLGYAFHKKFWNQGYASEIAKALVEFSVNICPKEKLVGIVLSGNEPSVRVLEKNGFHYSRSAIYFDLPFKVYVL